MSSFNKNQKAEVNEQENGPFNGKNVNHPERHHGGSTRQRL